MPPAGVPTCYRHPGREAHIRCQRCGRTICPDCMRDAAVGFQCVECVAEGKRTTRQGRTAYGGLRPTDASVTTMVLMAINIGVWAIIFASGGAASRLYELLALAPTGRCAVGDGSWYGQIPAAGVCERLPGTTTWVPGLVDGAYWQLISSAFTHEAIWHIAVNMLSLYVLGPQLEALLGRTRFLSLYLISGLAASAVVYWASDPSGTYVGASGAIFGLLGGLLVIAYKVGGNVQQLLMWLGLNAIITFTLPNISWQGHLGGLVGGALVTAVLVYAPRGPRRTAFQVSGLVTVTALIALAVILRSATLAA
jgi:membrane associated rhomboid family serine protease